MKQKMMFAFVAASLLACNVLSPQNTKPTSEPVSHPPTEPTLQTVPPQPTESSSQPDTPQTAATNFTIVRLHPQDGDLPTLLAQEAQKASALAQMPVIEFDATWCGPCQAIEEGIKSGNELMLKAYAGTYIIKLNVDEWGWSNSKRHNFEFDGIPVYFKLDAQGHPTGETIDGNAWGENIPENIAPPMDKFFHGS